jgi:rubrerythrin
MWIKGHGSYKEIEEKVIGGELTPGVDYPDRRKEERKIMAKIIKVECPKCGVLEIKNIGYPQCPICGNAVKIIKKAVKTHE